MKKNTLKIRFNTENTGSLFWRIIIDGKEHLADSIKVNVPSHTTKDLLPNNVTKWHITVDYNELVWNGNDLTIN